jgi:uncharacterized delta-60 repeat protein
MRGTKLLLGLMIGLIIFTNLIAGMYLSKTYSTLNQEILQRGGSETIHTSASSNKLLWARTWDSGAAELAQGLAIDNENNIYVCGYRVSNQADLALIKYDSRGNLIWNTTWGGSFADVGRDVAVDSKGDIYVCGDTQSFGEGKNDLVLIKFASNGTKLWNITWGSEDNEWGDGIAVDYADDIYVCTQSNGSVSKSPDFTVIKYSSNGTQLWNTTWHGKYNDHPYDILVDSNKDIFVCGINSPKGVMEYDAVLVKFSSNGTHLWNTCWDASFFDSAYAIAMDSKKNIYLGGKTWEDSLFKIAVLKYDPNGTKLWNTTWGYHGENSGYGIAVDSADNIYLCGEVRIDSSTDIGILRYSTDGILRWNTNWDNDNMERGTGIAVDSSDNIYVCGDELGLVEDFILLKFKSATGTNFLLFLIIGVCITIGVIAIVVIVIKKRGPKEKGHWITKDGRRIFIKDKE